jgi:tetratricopeptide (TPR) repeat protein
VCDVCHFSVIRSERHKINYRESNSFNERDDQRNSLFSKSAVDFPVFHEKYFVTFRCEMPWRSNYTVQEMSSLESSTFVLKNGSYHARTKERKQQSGAKNHGVIEKCGDNIQSGVCVVEHSYKNCEAYVDDGNIGNKMEENIQSRDKENETVERNISEQSDENMPRKKIRDIPLCRTFVPLPVHMLVTTREGATALEIKDNEDIQGLIPGDVIRIAHPYYSHHYMIESVTNNVIHINKAFDYTPLLMRKLDDSEDAIERLHNPNKNHASKRSFRENVPLFPLAESTAFSVESSKIINALTLQNIDERPQLCLLQTRVWKLVHVDHDKRLWWRRQHDDGLVPWYKEFDEHSGFIRNLNVDVNLCELEMLCFDSFLNPDQSIHQQRVHYFEQVSLDDIIDETFRVVCDWYPKGSTIDIFKWAKLARSMKFLSTMRNSNHEVDMAFLRRQSQKKLTLKQFKSVLIDMAILRFPPPRYNESESLSQLLWTTVVNIPPVNHTIWSKAKHMAMNQELKYLTAQIRISACFRMQILKSGHDRNRNAAIMISKWTRKTFEEIKFRNTISLAKLDYVYRRRHYAVVICQKYWRMHMQYKRFLEFKSAKQKIHHAEINCRWKCFILACLRRRSLIMYMEQSSIQSFSVLISLIKHTDATSDEDVKLTIRVKLCSTQEWFEFKLTSLEIKRCLEDVILRKGPLSREELFSFNNLRMLTTRLSIVCKSSIYSVEFIAMGIIENGDLVLNEYFFIQEKGFKVSAYRTSESIILHLFDKRFERRLRISFSIQELSIWLEQYERENNNRPLDSIQLWILAQYRRRTKPHSEQEGQKYIQSDNLVVNTPHCWLQKGNENHLVSWLVQRITMEQCRNETKIILEYEILSDVIEKKATTCQSWWRYILSLNMARKEVHLQYEKQYNREKKVFFYIHIRTGSVKWRKPFPLKNDDDIKDPTDEWRVTETSGDSGTRRRYYYNPSTGQSSWLSENEAATIVQKKFRERQDRILFGSNLTFDQIVKAILFVEDVETKYNAKPNKLSNVVNFALLNHFIRLDIKLAKALYHDAMTKNPHHPVISRSYGIFILSTIEFPFVQTFEKANRFFREASATDPNLDKFRTTKENFIFWATLINPCEPQVLLNYALLHQCILGEYYLAEKIYRRALALDPNNQAIVENYNMFIDQRYPGGVYDGNGVPYVVLRRSIVEEERYEWGEFKYMKDPLSRRTDYSKFWLNTVNGTTRFEEPEWKTNAWLDRVRRSIVVSTFMNWVEYHDTDLQRFFVYNRTTNEYAWKR